MSAHPTQIQAAAQLQANTLFASLELSKARWLVTVSAPGSDKLSRHDLPGGDGQALLKLLWRLQAAAAQRTGAPVAIIVIQEAGLDGFWIHRLLVRNGIISHVVDPASIAVNRRHRRPKTDKIDGVKLLRTLMAWMRGERQVCTMVQPPSPEDEDRRRLTRERALALFDITQYSCVTQVAVRTGRRAHTVMDWVHAYNQGGPDALAFRRTGGRRPLFAHSAKPNSARRSAQPSARRPPHP